MAPVCCVRSGYLFSMYFSTQCRIGLDWIQSSHCNPCSCDDVSRLSCFSSFNDSNLEKEELYYHRLQLI